MSAWRLPTISRRPRGGARSFLYGLAWLVCLGVLHGGWWPDWLENAGKDGWYTDDVRNLLGYFAYAEPDGFRDDLIGRYSRAQSPFAHHLVVAFFARLGYLRELTQYGPAVLWVLTAVLAARCGARLGRFPGAVFAAALVFAIPVYPERISGFLSRAFCFPGVFLFAEGLIAARPRRAGAAVLLTAAFYPTVGAALGFGLALWLGLLAPSTGPRDPWLQRLKIVGATGGLAVLLLLPTLWGLSEFGRTTSPADWAAYPEAGPGGIAGPGDRAPWRGVLEELNLLQRRLVDDKPYWEFALKNLGHPLFDDTVLYAALGFTMVRARRDRRARRLLILGLTALFGHWVTRVFYPIMYAPTRALQYIWPPFFHLALVAGAAEVARTMSMGAGEGLKRWSQRVGSKGGAVVSVLRRWLPPAVRFAVTGLVLVSVSGYGSREAGFVFRRSEAEIRMERYVASLPPETQVAGWPDDPMSNMAWVSGRQAFMTGEMHIPHHVGYLEQLRPRLYDLFAAYLAQEPQAVLDFADKYRVTHFLVDLRHFGPRGPAYMAPYRSEVARYHREGRQGKGFALRRFAPRITVASYGSYRVLSVKRLREETSDPSSVTGEDPRP